MIVAGAQQATMPPTLRSGGVALAGVEAEIAPANGEASRRALRELFTALRASRDRPVDPRVAALALEITRDCKSDAERARALYDWVTRHISYDWREWAHIVGGAKAYAMPHDPLSVLERGTTVCAGYAWLYNDLARAVALESTFLLGDVRGFRGTADDALITPYQHAWNSVKIDDAWVLLDATWGARQPGEAEVDYRLRNDTYFATPADQNIFDHLPESEEWQLLDEPLPKEQFATLPNLKPPYFRDGLSLVNHLSDTIRMPAGGSTAVNLLAPEGVRIAATLSRDGQDAGRDHLTVVEAGAQRQVVVSTLPAGDYLLRLYSKPAGAEGSYDCFLDYAVKVE
jgi:transglutaminase/protease-like cytokinesis protein 3